MVSPVERGTVREPCCAINDGGAAVEAFRGRYPVLGYVGNRGARDDSVAYLAARGFRPWIDFILCA